MVNDRGLYQLKKNISENKEAYFFFRKVIEINSKEFDIDSLKEQLREAGFPDIDVVRIGNYEREGLQSSSMIKENIQLQEGKEIFFSRKERRN